MKKVKIGSDLELNEAQYYYISILPYFLMFTGLVFGIFFFLNISKYVTASAVSIVFGSSLLISSWIVKQHLSKTLEFRIAVLGGTFFITSSIIFMIKYLS